MAKAFLTALLGITAAIAVEAAFGANLADTTGASWVWTDITADARHDPGIPIAVGRTDNVSTAGASSMSTTLNNSAGNYTPTNPTSIYYPNVVQNTPIRERITLDGTNWFTRYQGYLDSANPVTDQSATVKGVQVNAYGALGRLAGLKKPLRSALYRATVAGSNVVAYWPMEDGVAATAAASGIDGGLPLTLAAGSGTPAWASDGPGGSLPLPSFNNGGRLDAIVTGATAGSILLRFAMRMVNNTQTSVPFSFETSSGAQLEFQMFTGNNPTVNYVSATTPAGTGIAFGGWSQDNQWHELSVALVQIGADIHIAMGFDGSMSSTAPLLVANETLGAIRAIHVNPGTGLIGPPSTSNFDLGHLTVVSPVTSGTPDPDFASLQSAFAGFSGETANARLTRLCNEQSIALALSGTSNVTMGPQSADTILNLLRECEAADHGVLFDGFGPGVGYQCRSARYSQSAALTLDMGANPPQVVQIAPTFDKQAVKNLYTVNRKNGGSGTYQQTDGPLGTPTIGIEDASVTVNLVDDSLLVGHASWLVSLGTVPGFRYPRVGLDMRSIPSKAASVLGMTIGARITINNPASNATDLPPDPIDLIVEGWTETTTADTWQLTLNCSPYAPNDIGAVGDTTRRIDSATTTTGTTWTTTVTGARFMVMDVGKAWTTAVGDFPLDIGIGGERMTVSAIAAWAAGGQNFTISARSVNGVVKTHGTGEAVQVWTDLVIGL